MSHEAVDRTSDDAAMLDRAFELGEHGRGRTSPNPFVGCVIAADGAVVGEGWTEPPPGSHAEVVALRHAGKAAAGATAYVTLEPCNHVGRTPPCSAALVDGGIARVVIAMTDPNPAAAGGAAALRSAGIEVVTDVAVDRGRRQHEVFLHATATGRPFVIAKTASSLDGYVADHTGSSKWITGPGAREQGHRLRAEVDAVVVGSGTVLADDPALTVRGTSVTGSAHRGPQPLRVVLDRRGRLDGSRLQMFTDGGAPPFVTGAGSPGAALEQLWDRGIRSVLVEGGPQVVAAFVHDDLVDRYELHLGGVILGGGLPAVPGAFTLQDAPRMSVTRSTVHGHDVVVTAYPRR